MDAYFTEVLNINNLQNMTAEFFTLAPRDNN